jgi:hypothetical protein
MNKYEAKYDVEGLITPRFREFSCGDDEQALKQAKGLESVISEALFFRKTTLVSLIRIERHEVDINE